jgi:hypothetical protein
LPPDALNIMSDFSYINITTTPPIRKFIYDVCIRMLVFIFPSSPTPLVVSLTQIG